MKQSFPITKRGEQLLKDELQKLKTVERPAVIAAIAEARSHGDLSENAEYDAAKNHQSFIEGRILEIENKLALSNVIDPTSLQLDGQIVFGATVELEDEDSGQIITYQIVGEDEADIKQGLINVKSPIARAMISKEEGDSISVTTPSGIKNYQVIKVKYI